MWGWTRSARADATGTFGPHHPRRGNAEAERPANAHGVAATGFCATGVDDHAPQRCGLAGARAGGGCRRLSREALRAGRTIGASARIVATRRNTRGWPAEVR